MTSVLGTILDPAADKALVGTLVITLTMRELLPRELSTQGEDLILMPKAVPLATIIVGRDLLLSLSAFYIRYTSLPQPVSHCALLLGPTNSTPSRKLFGATGTSQYHPPKCVPQRLAK
jgi:phosphatidylglycerophosphate synthase